MFYAVFKNPEDGLFYSDGIVGDSQYKFVTYYEQRYGAMAVVYKRQNNSNYMETVGYLLNDKNLR